MRNLNDALLIKRTEKLQLSLHLHFHLSEACSAEILRSLQEAIKNDDACRLEALSSQNTFSQISPGKFLPPLLLCSLFYKSRLCFQILLKRLEKLSDDISIDRSIIHRLTILIVRRGTLAGITARKFSDQEEFASENFMKCILEQLKGDQRNCLYERDSRGRLPIHYASQHGQSHICQLLSNHMLGNSAGTTLCSDFEGNSPLSLAVASGHSEAVQVLLGMHRIQSRKPDACLLPGNLLEIALNSEYQDIVASLLAAGVDNTYQNETGETLIYIAARSAHEECLNHLLRDKFCRTECLNSPESTHGRTSLMIASSLGNVAITEILINAEANINAVDNFAWSASEIAAYRGHIEVLQILEAARHAIDSSAERTFKSSRLLKGLHSIGNHQGPVDAISKQSTVDRADDKAQLFVNLGSLDPKNSSSAVDLSSFNNLDGVSPQTSTVFALEISILDESTVSSTIPLPVLEDNTNNPCCFSVRCGNRSKLLIKVFHLGSCVGSGIALILDLGKELGLARQSLARDLTIPIIETKGSRLIGTVTCTVVMVTPYRPPQTVRKIVNDIWRNQPSTKVVGHRGTVN